MRMSRSKERGGVVVELAFAGVLFFAVLFGVFDFGHMFYRESTLKYAVSQAARFATTGGQLPDEDNPGTLMSREDSILSVIRDLTGFTDLGPSDITISAVSGGGSAIVGAGGPGDVVTVRAQYAVPIISPYLSPVFEDGVYRFEVVTTFKNEEFPQA
jgi:Flp pilus assembly protein TadG